MDLQVGERVSGNVREFGTLDHIMTILPELVAEFCAVVIVPAVTQLLLPTIAVIDKSGTDHSKEVAALRHLPQVLSRVVQVIGPDHFGLLLGAHMVGAAVTDAHEAAGTQPGAVPPVLETEGGIGVADPGMTPTDEEAALLRVEGDSGVTQPWEIGDVPEIGQPIVPVDGPELKGL